MRGFRRISSVVLKDDLGVSMMVSMDLGPRLGLCLDLRLPRACGEFRVILGARGEVVARAPRVQRRPPGHPPVAIGEVVGPVDDGVDAGVEHRGQVQPVQHQLGDLGDMFQFSLAMVIKAIIAKKLCFGIYGHGNFQLKYGLEWYH